MKLKLSYFAGAFAFIAFILAIWTILNPYDPSSLEDPSLVDKVFGLFEVEDKVRAEQRQALFLRRLTISFSCFACIFSIFCAFRLTGRQKIIGFASAMLSLAALLLTFLSNAIFPIFIMIFIITAAGVVVAR